MKRQWRQAGVALLTALLVTSVAAVVAAAMAQRQHIDIRRSTNVMELDQAWLFALGVESWAKQLLARDRRENTIDHPKEPWATLLPPIDVEGAKVGGFIEDMQGRFNLNNLVDASGAAVPAQIERFRRLVHAVGQEDRFVDALVDWLDPDSETRFPDGAEDSAYLEMTPPYRPANSPMVHPSELLLVSGVTPEIYQALIPHISTLSEKSAININTATMPVLMALVDGLSETDAEQLVTDRGDEGYQTIQDFMAHPAIAQRQVQISDIAVSSSYFMINSNVRYERNQINLHSLVARTQSAQLIIVSRNQGSF
ncbi:MAG: type II secretion system minor pseudopilin GspK [Chromatiales bacterium]|jgi:general secretion pathway protein K|nr:type II secretion system minor pseudopilin GspK [Chromatiales bacterium]